MATAPKRSLHRILRRGLLLSIAGTSIATAGWGELIATDQFRLSGDFRSRLESDFDSAQADGSLRADRLRLRIRARLAIDHNPSEHLSFGLRLRSGSTNSHQSPHITVVDFDDNDTGDADFDLDRWFVQGRWEKGWAWTGRNSLPFWKQNELYWDDDATLAGVAGGTAWETGGGNLEASAGFFSLPVGMRAFSGTLSGLQIVYGRSSTRPTWKVAATWLDFDANPNDPDASRLLSGNGMRDYSLLVGSLELGLTAARRPLILGIDVLANVEDYSREDPDPITAARADETDGVVLSLTTGRLAEPGDWLAGYTWARIEALAVNAAYAQDDWMRWGSATETRASDFSGHELRFGYRIRKDLDLLARLYLVESLTSQEDGKRLRVDLNLRF